MRLHKLYLALWAPFFACTKQNDIQTESLEDSGSSTLDIDIVTDTSDTDGGYANDTAESNSEQDLEQDNGELRNHFSNHFQTWLTHHPKFESDLTRLGIEGGSFGGFLAEPHILHHEPILFIHGNSDRASGGSLGGWTTQRTLFLEAGFDNAELYATTYGPANPLYASSYRHDVETLQHIRDFIEAVLEYTDAPKIDIVTHSLGVTLTRKAILGGSFTDANQQTVHLG